jgi:hypothetical protein
MVWLTQKQMADLSQKDVRTVREHIGSIFEEAELQPDSAQPRTRRRRLIGILLRQLKSSSRWKTR